MKLFAEYDVLISMSFEDINKVLEKELFLEYVFVDFELIKRIVADMEAIELEEKELKILAYAIFKCAGGIPNGKYIEKALIPYLEGNRDIRAFYESRKSYYLNNFNEILIKREFNNKDSKRYLMHYVQIEEDIYKVLFVDVTTTKVAYGVGYLESENLDKRLNKRIINVVSRSKMFYHLDSAVEYFFLKV